MLPTVTPSLLKILVVDDTEGTRYSLARILRRDGFEVFEAANGTDALAYAQEIVPDLVTLDIHLPDMTGFEVCRRLKSNPITSRIPVLQISASYITSKDKIQGLDGGADGYLTHPVDPPVLLATVHSLVRYRELNKSLEKSEEQLRLAVGIAQIGMWDINPQTKEAHWSARAKEIFGFSPDADVSTPDFDLRIHPDDEQALRVNERSALDVNGPGVFLMEHRLLLPSGEVRWVSSQGQVLFENDGTRRYASRFVGTFIDVTARRLVEEQLRDAKKTAESANRAKTQFLANISHEIRTPIGIIQGMTDLVLSDAQRSDVQKTDFLDESVNYLHVIRRNAEVLLKLIDDLLDLSKVEADKLVVETLRFDLYAVVNEVISLLSLKAREKSLELEVIFDSDVPRFVDSDPTRLRQILVNLLGNALKFTERGKVDVRVSLRSELVIGQPLFITLEFRDTGVGLNEEQKQNLFEAFEQADASTTRRFGGTGLGLMLSRQLARAMGGELILSESRPEEGSTFTLSLPMGKYSPIEMISKPAVSANVPRTSRLAGLHVLLVEDSPDNQIMITRFLKLEGANVETASNGRLGVEKALKDKFDVVLMDIQMPVMDGYQAASELRAVNYPRPLIALTAHALKGEREKCLAMGFTDYLTKPLSRPTLIQTLEALRTRATGPSV